MKELPSVAIVLLTCHRLNYALRTVEAICKNLIYPKVSWYIAVDADDQDHLNAILELLSEYDADVFGYHAEDFIPGQSLPGKSWNIAWEAAHDRSPICLWVENDWLLSEELDITPYVKLLMEVEKVGMIRLGHLAINLNCTSMGYDGIHYLQMWRNMPYPFSGNPALRHRRFADAYGPYNEKVNPGDTELDYDWRFRHTSGPEIWFPLPGAWGVFAHIGQEQSYHVPE